VFSGRPAGQKKRRDDKKNIHSTLVPKFCTIDLHEIDFCFPACRLAEKKTVGAI
jgi:hypothetical protein